MMQSRYRHLRIGLVGLGLEAYWSQFAGLEERLKGYVGEVEKKILTDSRVVVNLGLVDTPEKAVEAAHTCPARRHCNPACLRNHLCTFRNHLAADQAGKGAGGIAESAACMLPSTTNGSMRWKAEPR